MISYDNYKNRIEKMAKVKRGLHKFRFLICGVLALIVGVTVGLMCAKGSYTSGMSLSAQTVNFNEPYEVTAAKAFLASPREQKIEYSLVGSNEWTTKKPVKAGKYEARTVTKKIVGYSYSPSVTFDILPVDAEFTITSNSVIYGNTPDYKLTSLVSGHKVDESALVFDYADFAAASTEVNAVESSLKIVDESGDDFTCCYNVTFSGKTLNIRQRNLTATPAEYSFTYDGEGHTCRSEVSPDTLEMLARGDTVSVETALYNNRGARVDNAVNVGSCTVRIESVKIMHGETDVTAHYNLSLRSALLTINPRKLTVTTQDGEKVYDGMPLVKTEVESENLVTGHTVSADNSTIPDVENVGTYRNEFGVIVLDGGFKDVTYNYEVEVNAGMLKILPCKLSVTTHGGRKIYDGTPLTNDRFTLDTMPAGFNFAAAESARTGLTDFGTKNNEFAIIVTKKSDGRVVTDNFDISYTYGTLEIEKRALEITTGCLGFETEVQYNGQEQSNATPAGYSVATPDSSGGLLTELGHKLRVDTLFTVKDVTAANGVDNATTYTVWYGGRDITQNYQITYTYGKLKIVARRVNVFTSTPAAHIYDGTAFSDTGYTTDLEGGGLYNGDTLILEGKAAEITEVGNIPNANNYIVPNNNYVIDGIDFGVLTVSPKQVKVNIVHATSVYGAEIPDNGFTLDCGTLPNGETLTFTTRFERGGTVCTPEKWEDYTLLNVGMYSIVANDDLTITGGNAHVKNYKFDFGEGGILNVTPREIYYVTATDNKVYDGTALQNTAYETYLVSDITKMGLLGGDKLTVRENPTSIVGVEKRPNANYYSLPQFNNNYRIDQTTSTANFGTLEITPRPITVELSAIDEVTYGETFSYKDEAGNYANSPDLPNGEKLKIAVKYTQNGSPVTPKDAGTYTAELDTENCVFYYADGAEIKGGVNNYTITCKALENLKIKQFEFIIKSFDFTKANGNALIYGDALNYPDYIGNYKYLYCDNFNTPITLPYGEQIKVLNVAYYHDHTAGGFPEKLQVGTHAIMAANISVCDKDGNEIQRGGWSDYGADENPYFTNYNYRGSDSSDLEVVPREITVTVDDKTATYGGVLPENTFTVTDGAMQYNEVLSLTFRYDREVKNAGDYGIIADKVSIDGTEIVDINNCNYKFTFVDGTLTVESKIIYACGAAKSCEYGEPLPDVDWWFEDKDGVRITEFPYGDTVKLIDFHYRLSGTGDFYGFHEDNPRLNVGEYYLPYNSVVAKDADGNDCRDNYLVISHSDPRLTVTPADITVTFTDDAVEYGDDLTGKTYSYTTDLDGKMPYGEVLTVDGFVYSKGGERVTPKDVDKYAIEGETVLINGSADGAGNYNVSYKGNLTVNKKVLNIRLHFGGYRITYGGYIGCYGLKTDTQHGFDAVENGEELKLPYGENLCVNWRIDGIGEDEAALVKEGGHVLKAHIFEIYKGENYSGRTPLYEGDGNNLKNYIITCEDSRVEVDPLVVHVDVEDKAIEYGYALPTTYDYTYADKYTNFYPDGWHLKRLGETMEFTFGFESEVKDTGEYPYVITGVKVYDKNGNLKAGGEGNFEFVCHGKLTVKPKTVYAVIGNSADDYGDGRRTTVYDFYLNANGTGAVYVFPVAESCSLDFAYYLSGDTEKKQVAPKNAGEYGIKVSRAYIGGMQLANGESDSVFVHKNFKIICVDGIYTIKPKTVKVVLNQIDTVTYGETFTYAAGAGNYANADTLELAYGEKLEVAVEYLIDGEVGTPKNANYTPYNDSYNSAYSARLKDGACKVYDKDGNIIEGGAANYVFDCDDLEDLKIVRLTVFVYVLDFNEQYGDFAGYPDEIGNYKRVEYNNGETRVVGVPYNEQFKIEVEYLDTDGNIVDDPKNVGTYKIRWKNAEVYDSDGEPIDFGMNNYSFATAAPYQGTLEIVPREVKIVLSSYEKEYGEFKIGDYGTFAYPETVNNYDTLNSTPLAFSEKIKVDIKYQLNGTDATPKDVGVYDIVGVDYTVYDGGNKVSKDNYRISYEAGKLKIIQKAISVNISKNMERDYGEELPEVSYYVADRRGAYVTALPYGDKLKPEFAYYDINDSDKTFVTPRNAATYGVTVGTAYVNEEVAPLESTDGNYFISVEDGELKISKAEITLVLNSLDDVYYGKKPVYTAGVNNYDTENSTRLAKGDELEVAVSFINYTAVDFVASEWACGEYTIELDEGGSLIHYNGETLPLTTNYTVVDVTVGYVTIAPRKVAVTFASREYVYGSGTAGNEKFTIAVDISDDTDGTLSATELPNGEELSIVNAYYKNGIQVKAHNAGVYDIRAGVVYVDGSEDGAGNYSFSYNSDATLTISKKTVEITLADMSSQYGQYCMVNPDGTYLVKLPETGSVKQTDGSDKEILANGETLIAYIKFTEVGKENTAEFIEPKDVGSYSVVATGFTVISYEDGVYEGGQESGAGDKLTNYNINCHHGEYKVTKRQLTVAVSDELSSVYGSDLPEVKPIITSDGTDYSMLPYGETLQISYHFVGSDGKTYYNENVPQNADEYDIILDAASINLGSGDGNYNITFKDGHLEITQRHIVVTVHGDKCTYGDGLPKLDFDITVNSMAYTLPYGETLVPSYEYGLNGVWSEKPVNAGVYEIRVNEEKCAVTGGNQRYENYDAEYIFDGSLTVERMELTVTIDSASVVYGDELPEIPTAVNPSELPHGDVLELDFTFTSADYKGAEPEAAGVYAISATASIKGGNASIDNYAVTFKSADPEKQPTLTILQREIEITLNIGGVSAFTYGTDFNGTICNAEISGKVEGQTINVAVTYKKEETGSTASTFARRARLMTARTAEDFMPKNVGKYVASLDLENCTVEDENGAVAGGISNYKLKAGFTCEDVKFEITPMLLTVAVKNATAVYGDKLPKIDYSVAETMPEGESLELTFSYATQPKHVGDYAIIVESEAINGGEKSNYVLSYTNNSPKLTITKKSVEVRASDMWAPYDTDYEYAVGDNNYDRDNSDKLAEGDILKITAVKFTDESGNEIGNRANAGTYKIVILSYEIVNADGENAYGDYDVTPVDGTLTIQTNVITIFTASDEKEYDGTPLVANTCTYSGKLADGFKIVHDDEDEFAGVTYVTAAGGVDNKAAFKIVDENDNDVTANYEIKYGADGKTYGKLTVTQRKIEVVSQSATREYNGEELTAGYSVNYLGNTAGASAIASTDTFTPTTVSQIDAGSRPNTVTFTITDKNGGDVSANYAVTRTFGILNVSRKSVNVTVKMGSAVYGVAPEISYETNVPLADGEALSFEVSYRDKRGQNVEPVIDGEYFILPAGDYRAYYVANSAIIEGGRAKASNYSFEFSLGAQFSITKRHIIITTATPEAHEYDGTEFYNYADYSTEWVVNGELKGKDGLLGGDELTVVDYAKRTEVGSENNICTYTADANYEIDGYEYGTLTVSPRSISITTDDITVTYDGKPHSNGTLIYNRLRLVEGHTVEVVGKLVEQTDYTTGVENKLTTDDIVIKDADGNTVTGCYAVSWTYGTIIIDKRPLAITTGSSVDTYDGAPHGNDKAAAVGDTLLTELNHEVKLLSAYTYTRATEGEPNTTKYKIMCGGKDLSHNYKIEYTNGTIVINKAPVTVTLKENVRAEYGSDYAELLSDGAVTLANGETAELKIIFNKTVDRIGTYTASVDWDNSVIKDKNGSTIVNGADNYEVTFSPVSRSFEVIARNVSLTLNAGGTTKFVYGSDYETAITNITASWATSGEKIKVSVVYRQNGAECTPENVGTYTAELDTWTVEGGIKENYNVVSCNIVTFEITPKDLTVDMDDLTVVYGADLVYPDGVSGYTGVYGLLEGHTIEVTPAFEKDGESVTPEFAGTYDIVCGGITVNGGAVSAGNYNLKTGVKGTLTIEGVNISIERKTVTKTYDGERLVLSENAPATEVTYYINGVEGAPLETGLRLVLDGECATADGNVSSSRRNNAQYKVVDASGNAAGNYVVTYVENDARLVITQRELSVTTNDATRSYNGAPLSAGCTYDESELVSGHTLITENGARIVDAGSTPNTMRIVIKDAAGKTVTANYDIKLTVGTLTVEEAAVTVSIPDMEKVYGDDINVNNFVLEAELVNGETLSFRVLYTKGADIYDGTTLLDADNYGIVEDRGNMAVSGGSGKLTNYILEFTKGATLTITPRHVTVTTATPEAHEYDGNPFSDASYTTNLEGGGLFNGDTLELVGNAAQITEVGTTPNSNDYKVPNANYVIDSIEYGTLEVVARTISVTTADINETYNGKPYSDTSFAYDESKLLAGHKIEVVGEPTVQLDATDGVNNVLEFKISEIAGGKDVTACYDIQPEYGTIVIERAALTVTLNKDGKVSFAYGDGSFDGAFKKSDATGLVSNDKLTTVALIYDTEDGSAPVNAGSYTASLDFENSVITYAGDGVGIDNYDISCEPVEFTIVPKNITLTLGAWADEEYDGGSHEYDTKKLTVPKDALLSGESIANVAVRYCGDTAGLNDAGTPVNAGTYYVFLDLDATTVNGADGEVAISTNYNVTCAYITFKVNPKKLTVTLSDVTYVYDGETFDFALSDGFATNLCDGDEIECNVTYSDDPVNAGDYTVTFDTNIVFTSGEKDNYTFDASSSKLTCKLTIEKRAVTVTIADRDVEKGKDTYTWEHVRSEAADGGEGFISSDIAKLTVEFIYTDKAGKPEYAVEYKNVSAKFGGEAYGNYNITNITDGTLIVTERRVLVTPVYNGGAYVYDGNAVDINLFGYTHVHNIENCADDDKYGFTEAHAQSFTATYTFTDKASGKKVEGTPVNAGTYVVSVDISGEGISSYLVESRTIEFTIARRPLSYTLKVTGDSEYTYSNSRPEFTATLTAHDGFVNGVPADFKYELFDENNMVVTRYNVGTYNVGIFFAGISNYEITATTAQITIVPRVLVITPNDPYKGVPQTYNGTNLTLGAKDFTYRYGTAADGDDISIVGSEFAPGASKNGNLTITDVIIKDEYGNDVKFNYTVYSVYNATNTTITDLGLSSIHFRVRVEYKATDVHYTIGEIFGEDNGTFPYTGKSFTYTFNGGEIGLSEGETLGYGHHVAVLRNTVTVPAAAGTYKDLITGLVKVYDEDNKNVSAIYNLICDNPAAGEIKVTENVFTVDLSGVDVSTLVSGEKLNCAVSGLYQGATPAHEAEVYAFNVDGEWIIGVTVFSTSPSGKRTDLSANYNLSESSTLSGATVKIITLEEAEIYSRRAIGVKIKVTAAQLAGGRGTLFADDGEGRWVLGNDYYEVDGKLFDYHYVQVLVFVDGSGNYTLGITVYTVDGARRKDVSDSYRLKDIVTAGATAEYISTSEVSNLQRELYIDFSGAFNEDGTPKIENGLLVGYDAKGLYTADNHKLEITCTDNGDGTYSLSLVIYRVVTGSTMKANKASTYKLVYPENSYLKQVTVVTGSLN